ncbi:MAG TPA: hypothetical protein VGV35_14030, partial [Bryobacteraceae bacterium]|nr:hypothetical protein [Bryobacteraceae bacterium]
MRGVWLVLATLTAATGASAQTPKGVHEGSERTQLIARTQLAAYRPVAASLHAPARVAPLEAEAVKEPLQKRSAALLIVHRAQLRVQLSRILPTQDTSRGLVVMVPDSLFSGRNRLLGYASERLARLVEAIPPDVTVRVEGYT